MAEFQEVIRQYRRMCNHYEGESDTPRCCSCPMSSYNNDSGNLCTDFLWMQPEMAEEVIMKWAAKYPEPTYPTWAEWHGSLFSDCGTQRICPGVFMDIDIELCGGAYCDKCINKPIPEHIAEKLGIKPIKED